MKTTTTIFTTMALLFLVLHASYAQEIQGKTTLSIDPANASFENRSLINESFNPPDLEGIWSFGLDGADQVTAAIHQQDEFIFGSVKSEGVRPWNAVLQGMLTGDRLDLNINYLMSESLVSIHLIGVASDENADGRFVRVDDRGLFEHGSFRGTKIDTDSSAYDPARVTAKEEKSSTPASSAEDESNAAAKPLVIGDPMYQKAATKIGSVPTSLGVGFVGDGTAGAGGMGLG